MKTSMLLVLPFVHFALTTTVVFPHGAVVAQQTPATVLDILGQPVHTGADHKYYICEFGPEYFRVAGLSKINNLVYLYDKVSEGCPVIISQGNRSEVVVDTALEIEFPTPFITKCHSHYWQVAVESPYPVMVGGFDEGYTFRFAQIDQSGDPPLYYLNYSAISPFCYNASTVDIGPLDKNLFANATTTFQFFFLPANNTAGIITPPPKWMNLLRNMY